MTYWSLNQVSGGTIADTIVRTLKREYRGSSLNGFDLDEREHIVYQMTGGATTVDNIGNFVNFPILSAPGWFFTIETGSSSDQSAVLNVAGGALLER